MEQTQVCRSCGRELPLTAFRRSRLGLHRTCSECVSKHQLLGRKKEEEEKADELAKARRLRISDFTPRELMAELKRRGYEFRMEFTETHIISSKDIEI